jgi:hypothetical protein
MSDILNTVHETAKGLFEKGHIDQKNHATI